MNANNFPAAASNKGGVAGLIKDLQVAVSKGQLRSLRVYNNGASAVFVQLHNVASTPADTAVPYAPPIPLAAGAYYESDSPLDFSTGIYVCGSSTAATKTLIATADLLILAGRN